MWSGGQRGGRGAACRERAVSSAPFCQPSKLEVKAAANENVKTHKAVAGPKRERQRAAGREGGTEAECRDSGRERTWGLTLVTCHLLCGTSPSLRWILGIKCCV